MLPERIHPVQRHALEQGWFANEAISDKLLTYMSPWYTLKPGQPIPRMNYSLTYTGPSAGNSGVSLCGDTITVSRNGDTFALEATPVPDPSLILIESTRQGMERRIGFVKDCLSGKTRVLRNFFGSNSETQDEYDALLTLASYGYSVPADPELRQIFLPWRDTILYDHIPGVTLYEELERAARTGSLKDAYNAMNRFGAHLRTGWQTLLDGTLPDGRTFAFPDNVLGNWISTGAKDAPSAFVRIDIHGLCEPGSCPPVTGQAYIAKTIGEVETAAALHEIPTRWTEPLTLALRSGYREASRHCTSR